MFRHPLPATLPRTIHLSRSEHAGVDVDEILRLTTSEPHALPIPVRRDVKLEPISVTRVGGSPKLDRPLERSSRTCQALAEDAALDFDLGVDVEVHHRATPALPVVRTGRLAPRWRGGRDDGEASRSNVVLLLRYDLDTVHFAWRRSRNEDDAAGMATESIATGDNLLDPELKGGMTHRSRRLRVGIPSSRRSLRR